MKKIVLIALALAFISTGKAATYENKFAIDNDPCIANWESDVNILLDYWEATLDEAFAIADRNFDACLEEWYGTSGSNVPTPPVLTPVPPKGLSPL